MAVASLFSLCAGKKWRFERQSECQHSGRQKDQLIYRDWNSGDIKDDIVDEFQLVWGCKYSVIHVNTLNLIKTRYKYVFSSIKACCSMILKQLGKRDDLSARIPRAGGGALLSGQFSMGSGFQVSRSFRSEVHPC